VSISPPVPPDRRCVRARAFPAVLLAFVLALLLTGCGDPSDSALLVSGSCKLERLASMPVEWRDNLLFLSGTINDKPVRLLLDTGAERTLLTEGAADRLELSRDPKRMTRTIGIGGQTVDRDARTHTLIVGSAKFSGLPFSVGRLGRDEIAGTRVDGLLGTDILSAFDVEIDAPHDRVTLYRARPCPDALPPWHEPYLAINDAQVVRGRMLIPIALDGVADMAILDTGAQATSVSERLARRAGVTDDMLRHDLASLANGASANTVAIRLHRFAQMRIGPSLILSPMLPVLPFGQGQGEALVGGNYLYRRRIWLSFAAHRVFVTDLSAGPSIAAR
jgi:predicted aspartyl protease